MRKNQKSPFRSDNISTMFFSTSVAMIFTELTGVIAILIDGVVTSRFLGSDVYSGIALLRPFTSIVLMLVSFFSTGCMVTCSKQVGLGDREDANEVFNLCSVLLAVLSVILLLACIAFPTPILRLCGVKLTKYPELNPHMYDYLKGYMLGLPPMILSQIFGPIIVMDNNKKLFTISSAVLCIGDIAGDLLNVGVFHGGAFGMGLATAIGFYLQCAVLFIHFVKREHFFYLNPKLFSLQHFQEVSSNGMPSLIKRLASVLRDILTNRLNLTIALTTAAIAAKGIQGDLQEILFCISTGLGRTLINMTGIFYGSNDLRGLRRLFSYAMKFGVLLSAAVALISFLTAPWIARIYTDDPEVISLSVFSIRFLAIGFVSTTIVSLYLHFFQGIHNKKMVTIMTFSERFFIPVIAAYLLGMLFGSKGILASSAVTVTVLVLGLFVAACARCKGLPRQWDDLMFLPKDFGGSEDDNMYAVIRTVDDVIRASEDTDRFCMEHGSGRRKAMLMALFVEEMSLNILDHETKKGGDSIRADFRLFVDKERISLTLRDLCDHFDPTEFYQLHHAENPEAHIGIRMVTDMATEIRYSNAYNSNNLMIHIE